VDSLEIARRIQAAGGELCAALRQAAAEDLPVRELAEILKVTFTERNKIEAAVTSAIGALDEAAHIPRLEVVPLAAQSDGGAWHGDMIA
jgi:hypothetical protein